MKEIEDTRLFFKQKENELQEYMDFLKQQIANNKESEYAIEQLNSRVANIRSRLLECQDIVQTQSGELVSLRKLLKNLTNNLQQKRQKNRQTAVECEKRAANIEKLKDIESGLKKKLKKIGDKNINAQDRFKHFNELAEVRLVYKTKKRC